MVMKKTALLLNNRYQLVETLGRGGFGETYLAIDTHLPSQKKCVIKQLKPNINESDIPVWMQERFQQEARILEHLGAESSQIPRLFAYFSEEDKFYLVQEWIEGITLAQKVEKKGKLSAQEVEKILISLLPVLDYVHRQKIVHRDIKPDNIILRAGDELPILIDFGAVKEAMATVVTHGGNSAYSIVIGTPGYMASEQAAGRPLYSSDLYSLALTAVYLLTGKSPQYLKTDSRTGEILWREAAPEIHSNLSTVLDKAIRFHPKDRFSSAQEMLDALQIAQDFSSNPTIAIGNQKLEFKEQVTHDFREEKTVAVNYSPIQSKKNNWFAAFLPLVILSGVALASFIFGFNVLLDKTPTPETEISEQPNSEPIPNQNNNSKSKETKQREETRKTPEIEQPESNLESVEETPAPEVIAEKPSQPTSIKKETPDSPLNPRPVLRENPSLTSSIPIVSLGTSETELINQLGQPTSESKGYWQNSIAFLYKDINQGQADLGYILDRDSKEILQTEVSFQSSVDLGIMNNTLNRMLEGNVSQPIQNALQQVYQRETDLRSFNVGDLKGMIQRNSKDRIYIAVWKSHFH